MSEYGDISQLPEEEKFKIYDLLGPDKRLVLVQELQWPLIQVSYPNPQSSKIALKRWAKEAKKICFITDILSVEKWFCLKKGYKQYIILPPTNSKCWKYGGFAVAAATVEDAIKKATIYYKKKRQYKIKITKENGWQIKENNRYFQSFFSGV